MPYLLDLVLPYLLNLAYLVLLVAALPWLVWQSFRKGKYREGLGAKLLGRVPRRRSVVPCVWFHAVSVGEVNLLATLLDEIARRCPEWECAVSTTTMTGMALATKKYPGLRVFYCPLDFSWAVRAAVRRVRPNVLVLAELELWPNLVRAAKESGAQVAVVNGRLSERSFRGYRRIRPLAAWVLRHIDLIAAQDETYAERFRQLGARPEAVHVTGSMKYDGAQTDRANPATQRLRGLAGIGPDDIVFLAGSTQEPEEAAALEAFRQLRPAWPRLRLILVPRHPDRFAAVGRLLDQSGLAWQRRSRLETEGPDPQARVLLVDTVGELGAWWGTAQIAFVGGSLGPRGGQNMIEPAAYGAAVSFGPNTRNFRDIVAAMLDRRAAVVVNDAAELTAFVRRCLEDPSFAAELGRRAKALVASQLGATTRTFELLRPLVESADAARR
ncbi:MAG: 3-deoxy-D-manno-octulosonic acid transferase [Thermoguttaceae bacterium]|nr:3-deoxy-D-manno-octulosonic acid transferase [Thermoguttaceae bacterium]